MTSDKRKAISNNSAEEKIASKKATSKSQTFSAFLSDPLIATALLVFAFVALMFSLHDFLRAKGF